jgi:uncharacterized repeat protein (TIGR03803 family)
MKRTVNVLSKLNWGTRACAVLALCATTAIALPAQTLTTLYSFCSQSGCPDGYSPYAGLVQATNGDLYGTTYFGGTGNGGTIFKIAPGGTLTTVHSFCSQSGCPDGDAPAGLVQAANGDFYGTTSGDRTSGNYGTVFKITPSGTLTTLYSFCSQSGCTDGSTPVAGLVQAANGDLYGTAGLGGASNYGTVFKITPSGTLTTLYSFCSQSGCTDGSIPLAGLVQATDGDFYGTTDGGAGTCPPPGCGTVFKITPSGTLTTLHSFNGTDGYAPDAGLVQATDGDFYGTTEYGGTNGEYGGTVFKITPGGTLTTLYRFCSQTHCADGGDPSGGLVQAADGDLYGTTKYSGGGGGNFRGTIFKMTPSGTLTTLYSFCSQTNCADGTAPQAGLVQDTNGDLYGTTSSGGENNDGTVFRLSVGLGPFVKPRPPFGKVGAAVKILGTNLTGAASVSFDGTAAVFTVVSGSEITTTVPAGASSGKVQVITPSGTLSSNASFRVVP